MIADAMISECGTYRWWLKRAWGSAPQACFIMLNPSTADAEKDDPTIRRCIAFARDWGFGSLIVVNLFAYRSTDKLMLRTASFPVGEFNDYYTLAAVAESAITVAAWGDFVPFRRDDDVQRLLGKAPVYCLGKSKKGQPYHPLYLPKDLKPLPYWNVP